MLQLTMNKMIAAGALFSTACALSACFEIKPSGAPLVVNVQGQGEECRVSVNGERVTSAQLTKIAVSGPAHRGIIVYDKDAPYKCTASAIILLQQAGFQAVDAVQWHGS